MSPVWSSLFFRGLQREMTLLKDLSYLVENPGFEGSLRNQSASPEELPRLGGVGVLPAFHCSPFQSMVLISMCSTSSSREVSPVEET